MRAAMVRLLSAGIEQFVTALILVVRHNAKSDAQFVKNRGERGAVQPQS